MEFRKISDGRPMVDGRVVLNGIFYVLLTGCGWMNIPVRYWH